MQKFSVFNMDDLNMRNLMTIFNVLNVNIFEDHHKETLEYLFAKAFCSETIKNKLLFHRISKVYEVNLSLNQIFSVVKSLQLFEWSEISSDIQISKIFLYCINNGIGDCFLSNKIEGLFEEKIDEEEEDDDDDDESEIENEENEEKQNSDTGTGITGKKSIKKSILNDRQTSSLHVDTDELQSPLADQNQKERFTFTKKIVSFSNYKKSTKNEISMSEDNDSEEEADIVGELPDKYGLNSPFSTKQENELIDPETKIEEIKENEKNLNEDLSSGLSNSRQKTLYDQSNNTFKITLQKSQSMSTVKHRKSSLTDINDVFTGIEADNLDIRTFLPIQEFSSYGVVDIMRHLIERSKKTKKKKEKMAKNIEKRNLSIVFDLNMLETNEEEIVTL